MIVLNRQEVERLLEPDQLVEALAEAMADLSRGAASVPPRATARIAEQSAFLGAMPAYLPSAQALASKLVTIFPRNAVDTHQAVIAVFDPLTGTMRALLDGTYLTAARTAAGSVLATRYLARQDAEVLAVLGTGVQARSHARAMARFKPWREVRVAGRSQEKVWKLVEELLELDLPARACGRRSRARMWPALRPIPPSRWCAARGCRRVFTSTR